MAHPDQLILKGVNGIAEGEVFYIGYGQAVTIGRSRTADISLRHLPGYQDLSATKLKSDAVLSISRKHLRISFYNWQCVELKDLSINGTFAAPKGGDYARVAKKVITDIKDKSYESGSAPTKHSSECRLINCDYLTPKESFGPNKDSHRLHGPPRRD